MPTLSEFFGISIFMYYDDHAPPHFHAYYGDDEVLIRIAPLEVLEGTFPIRALNLVMEWAEFYEKELLEAWKYATNHKKLQKIPPLK